ncbi:MAG: class I SAM-dependent methyltransferase [Hyphomicrobiaceae bacterium]|nr:class I SAM-dependent methyltransferase [Hyphomicrobiaceae bacterium]
MDWIAYWDGSPSVYVCRRHKEIHYRTIADGIAALVEKPHARVLDFGCGEALAAERVARSCGHLYLADAAANVRASLSARFADAPRITVLDGASPISVTPGSLDLIVVNSVVQYLTRDVLGALLEEWRPLLAQDGRIVFADIVPPDLGPSNDAAELLKFARANGFVAQAIGGLLRTALSDYRKLRTTLGLSKYSEQGFMAFLLEHGFAATRIRPNLGHNQRRMAFSARPIAPPLS